MSGRTSKLASRMLGFVSGILGVGSRSGPAAALSWAAMELSDAAGVLRFRGTGGGAFGSLGFRVLFFGASVFVAELPFGSNETFGFLPGFFRTGAATAVGLTTMLEC